MILAKFILIIVLGYLLGSIPFGVIVSRIRGNVDILKTGSGKMGTTNVLRTAGAKAAVMVLVGDMVKGILAVVFAGLIFGNDFLIVHNFGLGALVAQVLAALAASNKPSIPRFIDPIMKSTPCPII